MYVFQDFDFKNYIGLFRKKNKQGWGGGGGLSILNLQWYQINIMWNFPGVN